MQIFNLMYEPQRCASLGGEQDLGKRGGKHVTSRRDESLVDLDQDQHDLIEYCPHKAVKQLVPDREVDLASLKSSGM